MLSAAARAKPSDAFAVPLHTILFFELPSRRQLGRAGRGGAWAEGGEVSGARGAGANLLFTFLEGDREDRRASPTYLERSWCPSGDHIFATSAETLVSQSQNSWWRWGVSGLMVTLFSHRWTCCRRHRSSKGGSLRI